MCLDEACGGEEVLCCICAPLAAIFCCKFCKDKMGSNNVSQAPENSFYPERDDRRFDRNLHPRGYPPPPPPNPARFYPGYSQQPYPPQPFQENYYPRHHLPPVHIQQQPRQY